MKCYSFVSLKKFQGENSDYQVVLNNIANKQFMIQFMIQYEPGHYCNS
jgi:hypothetical protein